MRLTFRKKALLLILPILGFVSTVYTYEAIKTEKEIARTEIIKRAEAITKLATKTGELPILSGNPEVLKGVVSSLRDNSEVASVSVYDSKMNLLVHDGSLISGRSPVLSPDAPMSMFDEKDMFVFYAPVFTVRAREDVDIFQEGEKSRQTKDTIGWVRLGFSKAAMNEAAQKLVLRGLTLAIVFTVGSSIAVFFLITIATKPLMVLFNAARKLEKGEYPEIRDISSTDEIGELGAAFNKMSMAIKEREGKLVDSENRIRELFERVEHAIFRLNKDGAIIEANAKFRDLFGDVHMFGDILVGKEKARNCFRKASARSAVHLEEKAYGKDETALTVLLSLYPEAGQKGELRGFDGYIIDITEKKGLEERLIRSQKLEAVGTMAGGIAHDFNNLLQAILGYSEMMLKMTKEGDVFDHPVKIIHNAAKRGAELTKAILSVTRKEKMEKKTVAVNEIVRSSIELLQRSLPKNIDIMVELCEDIPDIMADPSQIQQVILNLAVNARDAMPDGGTLTIKTELIHAESSPDGKLSQGTEGHIKLSISDTGMGMDKTTREKIFDPFFTTKEAGKGTGLGLYIVHSIIINHGGYIDLYSEQGEGTRFSVYLPIVRGEDIEEPHATEDLTGAETILVIDDERVLREMCSDMLTPLGYEILLAESGDKGIGTFRQMKDKISLVILDMVMPKMSGSEVFRLLKTINPGVKILLCSGHNQHGYAAIQSLLQEGAAGFIQKPFVRRDIALAIKKALSKRDKVI